MSTSQPSTAAVSRLGTRLLQALGIWGVVAVYAMLVLWIVPRTVVGWAVFLVLGPLVVLVGELVVVAIFDKLAALRPVRELSSWVTRRTGHRRFSVLRVLVMLVSVLTLGAVLLGGLILIVGLARRWPPLDRAFEFAAAFLETHFWP